MVMGELQGFKRKRQAAEGTRDQPHSPAAKLLRQRGAWD